MPIDTTKVKVRHAASFVSKLRETLTIAGGSYPNTWRGASEVITRYVFPKTSNFSIQDILNNIPANPNYVLAVAWYENDVMHRFKLWEDVGEIFWGEIYSGQTITSDFFALEVWTTNADPIVVEPITFTSSRLIVPTNRCDSGDINTSIVSLECGDPIFHFTVDAFNPSQGDYYVFDGYCLRVIVRGNIVPIVFPFNILHCDDDDTWHYVWMETVEGNVNLYIDPAEVTPPVGALGYFPMIDQQDSNKTIKVNLELVETNYHIQFDGETLTTGINIVLLQNEVDSLYYSLILQEFTDETGTEYVLTVGQTPTTP